VGALIQVPPQRYRRHRTRLAFLAGRARTTTATSTIRVEAGARFRRSLTLPGPYLRQNFPVNLKRSRDLVTLRFNAGDLPAVALLEAGEMHQGLGER
jgi:hypothetical protein